MERSQKALWPYALPCLLVAGYFGLSVVYALVERDSYASSTPHLLRYVIAPALISMTFFVCAFLLNRESKALVGLLALAVLGAFFSFELISSFRSIPLILGNLGYVDPEQTEKDDPGIDEFRVILPKNVNRVLGVQKLADAHLSASIPNTMTLLCSKNGIPIYYISDKFGFNNPNEAYSEDMDIVVIGDSQIEGFCVEPGQDLVSQLRKSYPHTVGLAVRNNGPLMALATLGRYGPVLRPRNVVFGFFAANDWRNLQVELHDPWLREALSRDADFGSIAMQHALIERAGMLMPQKSDIDVFDVLVNWKFVRNFLALSRTSQVLGLYYPATPEKIPEIRAILENAKRITESWGGQLYLLYIPGEGRQIGILPNEFAFDILASKVLSAAKAVGIPTISMGDYFDEYSDSEVIGFYSGGHLSEAGAKLVADVISSRIAARR